MFGRARAAALAMLVGTSLGLVVVGADPAAVAAKKPPKPVVSKIDPKTGSTAGGSLVTIKGKHLKTAKKVLFGKAKGTGLKVKSDKKLTVLAPPHSSGPVDVIIKTKGGKSAKSSKAKFTYAATRPQVTGLSPNIGPDTGGTRVTVTGAGFAGVTAVTFEGTPGTAITVSSPSQLTVTSPEHAPGRVNVQVVTAAGTSPAKTDLFTYTNVVRSMVAPVPADAAADPGTDLRVVTCPEIGVCFAVGNYVKAGAPPTLRPLIEQRTGTESWTPISPALPGDAFADPDARLVDISCPSTSFCVAVGAYQSALAGYVPLVATYNGTSWTLQAVALPAGGTGAPTIPIAAVDCPTTTSCVGVGFDDAGAVHRSIVITMAGASWTSQALTPAVGVDPDQLADVSCATATDCVAVGAGHNGLVQVPLMATLSGGAWTVTTPPVPVDADPVSPNAFLEAVSCTGASTCTAVGTYRTATPKELGLVEQETSGTWTPVAVNGPPGARTDPSIGLHALSCVTGLDCLAVGEYVAAVDGQPRPLLVPVSSFGPDPVAGPVPAGTTGPDEGLDGVACVVITACAAVGRHASAPGLQVPLLESRTGAVWVAGTAPVPPGSVTAELYGVTGDGPTGLAVGGSIDAGGVTRGLITIDIPVS